MTGLDISDYAISQAQENARRNHLENTVHFRCANVFDELPKLAEQREQFDVVILDPPAFTKSREATEKCNQGLPRDQYKGTEACKGRWLSGDVFLFTFYDAGASCKDRARGSQIRT